MKDKIVSNKGLLTYKETSTEKGRSMIEIIAVLALVAVLTVVGILGFSKAMEKYKANKIKDQISTIRHNLQEIQNKQQSLRGLNDVQTAIALEIFPPEMVKTINGEQYVIHAGGSTVDLVNEDGKVSIIFNGLLRETTIDLATKPEWNAEDMLITQEREE